MSTHQPRTINIPQEFYSLENNTQFDRCLECDKYLLGGDTDYFIEKAIKKYDGFTAHDVIFEYAICMTCAEKIRMSLSKESMQSLEQYFIQNVDAQKRFELMQSDSDNYQDWLNNCLISGKSTNGLTEYQLFAQCRGNQMILGQMPYLVSGEILENIAELLSPETKDELDNFSKKHFGPDPKLAEELPFQRVLLV